MTTLDYLITSRTLVKVIHHFCNFDQPLPMREIARRINEDPGNVHRMIKRLEKAGLVEKQGEGYGATNHAGAEEEAMEFTTYSSYDGGAYAAPDDSYTEYVLVCDKCKQWYDELNREWRD